MARSFYTRNRMRWSNILVRTLHIACIAVVFGGIILQPAGTLSPLWHQGMVGSGIVLLILEWLHDSQWPHRGKGLMVHCHILCAIGIPFFPRFAPVLVLLALVFGSVGSHMPRYYRHWSVFHGPEIRKEKSSR